MYMDKPLLVLSVLDRFTLGRDRREAERWLSVGVATGFAHRELLPHTACSQKGTSWQSAHIDRGDDPPDPEWKPLGAFTIKLYNSDGVGLSSGKALRVALSACRARFEADSRLRCA